MSQTKSRAEFDDTSAESDVADYLRRHPDFFERNAGLLLKLRLPHQTGASTVSLVERQVSMLRNRNSELERQLKDLVAVAKLNNALVEKIHQLSVKLMAEQSLSGKLDQLERSLREDFAAERAVLILFENAVPAELSSGFTRRFDRDDAVLKPYSAFLRAARPRCGPLRDRQREVAFGREADSIASAAMVPLGENAKLGFLVVGSRDPAHFHPGKRMDFLARLGELVAVAIESGQADRESS
jgi:uncharacterized protein YigA (DUF484 family)